MGRALVLQVVERPSSIDETLLHSNLRLTPDQRLKRFEHWYDDIRKLRHEVIESRARRVL